MEHTIYTVMWWLVAYALVAWLWLVGCGWLAVLVARLVGKLAVCGVWLVGGWLGMLFGCWMGHGDARSWSTNRD